MTSAIPTPGTRARIGDALKAQLAAIGDNTETCFRIVFADGSAYQNHSTAPAFVISFTTARAERSVFWFGHVGLLESYFNGGIDIDGNIALMFRVGFDARYDAKPNPLLKLRNRWHEWRFSNRSLAQAKQNARYHYALGQVFYRYWLDQSMMYTCAYWCDGTSTLEQAQRNKLDHVCRKIQLKAGETFIDIGCGWGGLLFHAWEHYGAFGTGINITTEQVAELRADIARRGLDTKIRVIEADFREIPGQYDKMLSIGTLEHAGRDQLPEVVAAHAAALKPGGIGIIHFIGHVRRSIRNVSTRRCAANGAPIYGPAPRCFVRRTAALICSR